jgi:hypothetical protein
VKKRIGMLCNKDGVANTMDKDLNGTGKMEDMLMTILIVETAME